MTKPVVLIADKLAPSTVEALGDSVEVRWVDGQNRPELLAAVPEADALLVRSATTVDREVIEAANFWRLQRGLPKLRRDVDRQHAPRDGGADPDAEPRVQELA